MLLVVNDYSLLPFIPCGNLYQARPTAREADGLGKIPLRNFWLIFNVYLIVKKIFCLLLDTFSKWLKIKISFFEKTAAKNNTLNSKLL